MFMLFMLNRPRAVIVAAGLMACLVLTQDALAQAIPRRGAGPTLDEQIVRASRDWFDALARLDVEAVERIETDDFLTIQRTAAGIAIVGREQQLEGLRRASADRPRLERELSTTRVRRYGTVAVLTAFATFTGEAEGRSFTSQAILTEIWVLEDGRWRLAHFQSTDVPSQP